MRRAEYLSKVIATFGDDGAPDKTVQERAYLRRQLAAQREVSYDENENRAISMAFASIVLIVADVLWTRFDHHPTPFKIAVVSVVWVGAVLCMLPVIDANRRIAARRALYSRLGARPDLPSIPRISRVPFGSRTPSSRRIHVWISEVVGIDPRSPDTITTEQVAAVDAAIQQWCYRLWWKLLLVLALSVRLKVVIAHRSLVQHLFGAGGAAAERLRRRW